MIQLHDASKRYGPPRRGAGVEAVRQLSLEIPQGATWAVVGPNGAGKSTLFGLILGFLRPTAGEVEIDGLEPRRYIRRHGVSYLPERFAVPAEWPVRDALVGLARLDALGADAVKRADEMIERFGLAAHAAKLFGELSHGLRQRVGLAQALLGSRALVVLDEPTGALDPLWRVRLRDTVAARHGEGATILIASHDLTEVERLAERVVVIDAGSVREVINTHATEPPREFLLRLAEPSPHVDVVFPGAIAQERAGAYVVTSADAEELSGRLAALLATGALLTELQPLPEPLEERVRRVLDPPQEEQA